jgi:restriction endonuclease Mrr
MTKDLTTDEALAILRESIKDQIEQTKALLKDLVEQDAYDEVRRAAKHAEDLEALRQDLSSMAERFADVIAENSELTEHSERLPRGLRTPEEAFRVPILEALVELGGEAPLGEVLDRVEEMMGDQLNEHDRAMLPSGDAVRWRNTAQWARNALRKRGFIRDDSPRGIWAISKEGRHWLKEQGGT